MDMVSMANSHIMYVTFKYFCEAIEKIKCPNSKEHLRNLARVYALTEI